MTPTMRAYLEANQPASAQQVAEALGITRQSFYEQALGHTRVAEWTRGTRGHAVALYALGTSGYHAPKPDAMPQAQRSKAYWERHSAMIRARRPSKAVQRLGVWAGLMGASA